MPSEWVYCKLYVGTGWGALDFAAVEAAARVRELLPGAQWFFLRYTDKSGPHLRLRVRSDTVNPPDRVRAVMESIAEQVLGLLPVRPPSQYRPLIDLEPLGELPPAPVGFAFDTYVPELEKFGGPAGVEIAEDVFHASSELASVILKGDRDAILSRKTVAPRLMDGTARAFLSESLLPTFWSNYSIFWLGGESHAAGEWRERFDRQAEKLLAEGVPILVDLPEESTVLRERSASFEAALSRARARLAEVDGFAPAEAEAQFAFQFVHLSNNRLGFWPIEEAYLAALVAATVSAS